MGAPPTRRRRDGVGLEALNKTEEELASEDDQAESRALERIGASVRIRSQMKFSAMRHLERNVHRAGEIIGVLAKYGLADWVRGLKFSWVQERIQSFDGQHIPDLKIEERVRLAFSELGATFIKLGQMLSTRPDLVGPEMARELARLQTAAPADPPDTIRSRIESEFDKSLSSLFAQFEEAPLASASIAQVHLARLHSGEQVVVKVQHAGIADKIMPDLDILAGLAELAEKHASQIRLHQPVAVVRQFRRTLLRELDFTFERRNLEEFAQHFARDDTVHFPCAYARFSTRHVLTMERLEGILGSDSAALAASGADLNEFARRGANMYLQMIFRDAFYHADPHPGNLMLLPGGVVGVLDCGMVGRLDEELAEGLEEMLMAVVNRSSMDLGDILLRLGSAPPAHSARPTARRIDRFRGRLCGPIHPGHGSGQRAEQPVRNCPALPHHFAAILSRCCCARWSNWRAPPSG